MLGLCENFFGRYALNFARLDFLDATINLGFPGSFCFWIGAVKILG
jgi:hypothetical protein